MEQPQNFRAAFHGFNREDVVHYLEFLNTRHNNELTRLNRENDDMRRRLEQAENKAKGETDAKCAELEAMLDAANAEKATLSQRIAQLEKEQEEAKAAHSQRIAQLEKELEAAKAAPAPAPVKAEPAAQSAMPTAIAELEAYRRAERAERMAKERAGQIYRETSGILSDATERVDEAVKQISAITDQVVAQLNLLQSAAGSSRLALQEASTIMTSLKPESV